MKSILLLINDSLLGRKIAFKYDCENIGLDDMVDETLNSEEI